MKIDFSDVNQDIVFVSAFRYCLGRQTYVVGSMVEEMIKNWTNTPIERRKFFKKEIQEAVDKGCAGSESIDVPEWKKILRLPDEGSIDTDPNVMWLKSRDPAFMPAKQRGMLKKKKEVGKYIR
jgi:hypothetical protein